MAADQGVSPNDFLMSLLDGQTTPPSNILESITDAFFSLNRDWTFTYVNREAERVLQSQRENLLGFSVWEKFPEAVGSTFYEQYHRAFEKAVTVEFEEFYPPLETWFEVKAYPSESQLTVYFRDVSERRAVQEQLRKNEQRLRLLIENADVVVFSFDRNGVFTFSDGRGLEKLGLEPGEIVGTSMYTFLKDAPDIIQHIEATLGGATVNTRSVAFGRHYENWYVPELSEEGQVIGCIGISVDLTSQVRAEAAEREQTRLQSAVERERQFSQIKTHLMRTVSHEFRTPLSIIATSTHILKRGYGKLSEDNITERLVRIEGEIDYLRRMMDEIEDTLEMQLESVTPIIDTFDVADAIQEVVETYQHDRQLEQSLDLSLPAQPAAFTSDQHMVQRIVRNLISNATKFSPAESSITVRVVLEGTYLEITVQDQGYGIEADELANVLVPFFRGSNVEAVGGTGLGLTLVDQYLQALGGTIDIISKIDEGTTVFVRLPAGEA